MSNLNRQLSEDTALLPAYSVGRAAHYLGLSAQTLGRWVTGWKYRTVKGMRRSEALLTPDGTGEAPLSFVNLVEGHVLAAIRQVHGVNMAEVRPALAYVRDQLHMARPLVDADFRTDGLALFVERLGELVDASHAGQPVMRPLLEAHLARVEWDGGLLARLFPFTRATGHRNERTVVLSPAVAFGRLAVAGTGVPTAVIASRFLGGDSLSDLAADYEIEPLKVEEALRWEIPALKADAA